MLEVWKLENSLISLIIPVYNVEEYLDRCINSVVKQTYSNLEIILINDGSTDKSGYLCDVWKEKDSRIIVIHKNRNEGLSAARNSGLDRSSGEYIGFVDSDDWIATDMYELLYAMLVENNADISHCSYKKVLSEKNLFSDTDIENKMLLDNFDGMKEFLSFNHFILSVWNKLYKRELISDIRFEVGRMFAEDIHFNFFAFMRAKKTIYINKPKYYYFQRNNSILSDSFSKKNLDIIYFSDLLVQMTKKYYIKLLPFAIKKDIIENILMIISITKHKKKEEYRHELLEIANRLKNEFRTGIMNRYLPMKYKVFLFTVIINKHLLFFICNCYLKIVGYKRSHCSVVTQRRHIKKFHLSKHTK